MTELLSWPALNPGKTPLPREIQYERGIWGKVHAARTDFRWIAQSSAFDRESSELAKQINLGTEDQPGKAQLWLNRDSTCYAVSLYPSRARDVAGRTSFLEKQVLAWSRTEDVPAALGALLLLPEAASIGDEIWWDRRGDDDWTDASFSLTIPPANYRPLQLQLEDLEATVTAGVKELREVVALDNLKKLYAQILGGQRPAWLTGLEHPLPPRALAVLLLPLPRNLADLLSLAGWIPSKRASLAKHWDVIVLPPHLQEPSDLKEIHPDAEKGGWALAQGLLNLDLDLVLPTVCIVDSPPSKSRQEAVRPAEPPLSPTAALRPRAEISLDLPKGASAHLRELHAFAQAIDRRWLDPGHLLAEIGSVTHKEDIPERLFPSWIETLRQRKPDHVSPEQWKVKLDLLRSAALVLRPAPDTLQAVGLPGSRHVPALFFALMLEKTRRDLLEEMGEDSLRQAFQQSLSCLPDPRARQVRGWIAQWQTKKPWLKSLIAEAVKAQ